MYTIVYKIVHNFMCADDFVNYVEKKYMSQECVQV